MTNAKTEKTSTRAANFGFSALLFTLLGWINLEVLMLGNEAGVRGQLLTCAIGIYLSTLAYRRYQFWWVRLGRSAPTNALQSYARASLIGTGFILAAVGFVMACFMRSGIVTTTVMGAAILTFIPWSRSRFCKDYFIVSQGLLLAGGLPVLIAAVKHQHPLILLAVSWALWTLAAGLLTITLWLQRSTTVIADKLPAEPNVYEAGPQ